MRLAQRPRATAGALLGLLALGGVGCGGDDSEAHYLDAAAYADATQHPETSLPEGAADGPEGSAEGSSPESAPAEAGSDGATEDGETDAGDAGACGIGDGGPDAGELNTGSPGCNACLAEHCCSQTAACASNPACLELIACITECVDADAGTEETCAIGPCNQYVLVGGQAAGALQSCETQSCDTPSTCGG